MFTYINPKIRDLLEAKNTLYQIDKDGDLIDDRNQFLSILQFYNEDLRFVVSINVGKQDFGNIKNIKLLKY